RPVLAVVAAVSRFISCLCVCGKGEASESVKREEKKEWLNEKENQPWRLLFGSFYAVSVQPPLTNWKMLTKLGMSIHSKLVRYFATIRIGLRRVKKRHCHSPSWPRLNRKKTFSSWLNRVISSSSTMD